MIEQNDTVLSALDSMGISFRITEHPPVFTIEEMEALKLENMEAVAKNLFLRDDKKRRFFLVMLKNDKRADLKKLSQLLGGIKLSFASEDLLMELLGLEKGAVSPLGILNDTSKKVELVLDSELLLGKEIAVHPNRNTATIWMKPGDLLKLIETRGNKLTKINI